MSIHEIIDKELTWGQAVSVFALVLLIVCLTPSLVAEIIQ